MHGVIHLLPEKNQPSASDSLVECIMNIANEKQTFTGSETIFLFVWTTPQGAT